MPTTPRVHIIDDDSAVRKLVATLLTDQNIPIVEYPSAIDFVNRFDPYERGCVVVDQNMAGMTGRDLQCWLIENDVRLPVIFITGYPDVDTAVDALKAGAIDFIQKPIEMHRLLEVVDAALQTEAIDYDLQTQATSIDERLAQLTPAERDVMKGMVSGRTYKELAEDLNVSYKTVEARRAKVLQKMRAKNLSELIRLMLTHQNVTSGPSHS
jgi:two-component system response regulator FixJ